MPCLAARTLTDRRVHIYRRRPVARGACQTRRRASPHALSDRRTRPRSTNAELLQRRRGHHPNPSSAWPAPPGAADEEPRRASASPTSGSCGRPALRPDGGSSAASYPPDAPDPNRSAKGPRRRQPGAGPAARRRRPAPTAAHRKRLLIQGRSRRFFWLLSQVKRRFPNISAHPHRWIQVEESGLHLHARLS